MHTGCLVHQYALVSLVDLGLGTGNKTWVTYHCKLQHKRTYFLYLAPSFFEPPITSGDMQWEWSGVILLDLYLEINCESLPVKTYVPSIPNLLSKFSAFWGFSSIPCFSFPQIVSGHRKQKEKLLRHPDSGKKYVWFDVFLCWTPVEINLMLLDLWDLLISFHSRS